MTRILHTANDNTPFSRVFNDITIADILRMASGEA